MSKPAEPDHRFPPLKAGHLAVLALGSVAQSFGPLLPVWIGLTLVNGVAAVAIRAWSVAHGLEAPASLSMLAAEGLVAGLAVGTLSGFAVRGFLGLAPWRADGGLARFVSVQVGLALVEGFLPTFAVRGALAAGMGGGIAGLPSGGVAFAVWCAVSAVAMMLTPWQVAMLVGDRRVTLGLSWRAMGGALPAYIGAYVAAVGLPALVYIYAWSLYYYTGGAVALGASVAAYCVTGMVSAALAAHVYHLRLGGEARARAAVFD
jgi:hypothetical protein